MLTNEEKSKLSKKVQSYISTLEQNLADAKATIRTMKSEDITRVIVDPYGYRMYLPETETIRFGLGLLDREYIDFRLFRSHGIYQVKVMGSDGILFHPESWNTGHLLLENTTNLR